MSYPSPPNPSGLCMCGCGAATTIAPKDRIDRGHVKGHPKRYVNNHDKRKPSIYCIEDKGYSSPCWIWPQSTRKGYGRKWVDGRLLQAHRHFYEQVNGPIPDGLQLDHLCRNRACVNPDHLEPVTNLENQRRGLQATKTHCVNGHPYDEANTYIRPSGQRDCRACSRERQARCVARRLALAVAA